MSADGRPPLPTPPAPSASGKKKRAVPPEALGPPELNTSSTAVLEEGSVLPLPALPPSLREGTPTGPVFFLQR